ncbi:hypothetical protein [Mycolicibacterium hodleri]|nr:hypothetical protein [Mycolicibacterium hodleri]
MARDTAAWSIVPPAVAFTASAVLIRVMLCPWNSSTTAPMLP